MKKKVVVVMARQQPGESPSSLMVQGMIDFLISGHRIAVQLREKLIFKIFPMMNPGRNQILFCYNLNIITTISPIIHVLFADGVFLGNYKGSLFGEMM